mmetsp:Transcript_36610/g.88424  ORF Transcript_36610/g.88424 Transcript_36610/m.88424 type:complete len:95 (+) Transcript_36610:107-391(+)
MGVMVVLVVVAAPIFVTVLDVGFVGVRPSKSQSQSPSDGYGYGRHRHWHFLSGATMMKKKQTKTQKNQDDVVDSNNNPVRCTKSNMDFHFFRSA